MRLLGRKITSSRVDAVIMLLVAWTLMDLAAVAYVTNTIMGVAIGIAAVASVVIAIRSWRYRRT